MHKSTVEAAIAWLETNGYIAVHRRKGCNNRYRITAKAEDKVFIVPWLDDMGLSVHEFRVLAHISAVADEDQDGAFHVNETNFAEKCSMHRNTVSSVVKALEDHELIAPYDNRENPWYHLALCGYQQDHQRKDEAHPEGDMHKIDNGDCTNQITELKKEELKKEELKKALNLPMTEDSGPDIFSEDEEAEEQEPVATSSTQAQPSDFLDRYFDAFGSLGYEEGFSASAEVQHIEAEQRKRRKLIVQRHLKEQVQRDHPDCDVLTAAEAWGVKQGPVATNDIRPKVQRTHVPRNLRTIRYLGSGALFSG
jgi:hypothetical protein